MENPMNNAKRAVDRHIAFGTEPTGESRSRIEKFSVAELGKLRAELIQPGIDSWQAADVLGHFLTERGYGVSPQNARNAIGCLEGTDRELDCIQEELEHVALVM
jgi:hypothetical protein